MLAVSLFAIATLLGGVLAGPVTPSPEETDITLLGPRQAGNGVHLVNCGNSYSVVVACLSSRLAMMTLTRVQYCVNDGNCNFFPSNNNQCRFSRIITWEGGPGGSALKECAFPTGVVFKWGISPTPGLPVFSEVGHGQNDFQSFRCFKDDQHRMYSDSTLSCNSIYYCLPR
ncbi:hypothetical protein OQA88_13294 [Cercophora sp. LCS_1]